MGTRDQQAGMPDILLERYLADDLSPEQMRMVEAQRQSSDLVRQRLDALEREKAEFLAADPPDQFAHRLATRLAVAEEQAAAAPASRRWWAWVLAPSAAAAATAVVTIMVVQQSGGPTSEMKLQAPAAVPGLARPATAEPMVGEVAAERAKTGTAAIELRSVALKQPSRQRRGAKRDGAGADDRFADDPADGRRESDGRKKSAKMAIDESAVGEWIESPAAEPAPVEAEDFAPKMDAVSSTPAPAPPAAASPKPAKPPAKRRPKAKPKSAAGGRSSTDDIFYAPRTVSRGDLDSSTIQAATRKQIGRLKTCIRASEDRGELAAGAYKLVLSWTIRPSGTVTKGRLVKPKSLEGTLLEKCLLRRMATWRYSPSTDGASVKGYSLSFKIGGRNRQHAPASEAR